MMLTGVGGILGGSLLTAGVNSLISGYLSEVSGDAYLSGWVSGGVSGFIMGLTVGIGGNLFVSASNASNLAVFGYLGLGTLTSFGGGFIAGGTNSWISNKIENKYFNYEDAIYSDIHLGLLNVMAGFGSGYSSIVFSAGNTIGYRVLGTGIALSIEGIVNLITYTGDKVVSWVKSNKRNINRIFPTFQLFYTKYSYQKVYRDQAT
ncbi:MAG: hypothetical protein WCZ19_01075 [Acholeplasma sp.]